MSKTYIVTAEIELEVLDCENEEGAIAHAEWRVSQPDFDFDFQAEEVGCTEEVETREDEDVLLVADKLIAELDEYEKKMLIMALTSSMLSDMSNQDVMKFITRC